MKSTSKVLQFTLTNCFSTLYRWQISRHFFRIWWFGLCIDNNKLLTISNERLQAPSSKTNILVKITEGTHLSRVGSFKNYGSITVGFGSWQLCTYKLFTISNERLQVSSLTTTSTNLLANHWGRNHLTRVGCSKNGRTGKCLFY